MHRRQSRRSTRPIVRAAASDRAQPAAQEQGWRFRARCRRPVPAPAFPHHRSGASAARRDGYARATGVGELSAARDTPPALAGRAPSLMHHPAITPWDVWPS
jgi:hypothetical protein